MIARLTGVVDSTTAEAAVVDVGGVGYLVFCSSRSLGRLPAVGGAVSLFVETHVREDHIHLYGFIDAAEREWFRLLTTVQGVGAKLALAILGVLSSGDLTQAILVQDKTSLTRASGVVWKTYVDATNSSPAVSAASPSRVHHPTTAAITTAASSAAATDRSLPAARVGPVCATSCASSQE